MMRDDLTKVYAVARIYCRLVQVVEIESRDTETAIRFIPANPSTFSDKVGDGKLIRIDRDKPALDVITNLTAARITDGNDNDNGQVLATRLR